MKRLLVFIASLVLCAAGWSRASESPPIRLANLHEYTGQAMINIAAAYICFDFTNVSEKPITAFDLLIEFRRANGAVEAKQTYVRSGVFAPNVLIAAPKNPNSDGLTQNCVRLSGPSSSGLYNLVFHISHVRFADGTEWPQAASNS